MSQALHVSVFVDPLKSGRVQLLLAVTGSTGGWSKVYDGSLFLSMDAQALGLLEEVSDPLRNGSRYQLKQDGLVTVEQLERMRFVEAAESAQQSLD